MGPFHLNGCFMASHSSRIKEGLVRNVSERYLPFQFIIDIDLQVSDLQRKGTTPYVGERNNDPSRFIQRDIGNREIRQGNSFLRYPRNNRLRPYLDWRLRNRFRRSLGWRFRNRRCLCRGLCGPDDLGGRFLSRDCLGRGLWSTDCIDRRLRERRCLFRRSRKRRCFDGRMVNRLCLTSPKKQRKGEQNNRPFQHR